MALKEFFGSTFIRLSLKPTAAHLRLSSLGQTNGRPSPKMKWILLLQDETTPLSSCAQQLVSSQRNKRKRSPSKPASRRPPKPLPWHHNLHSRHQPNSSPRGIGHKARPPKFLRKNLGLLQGIVQLAGNGRASVAPTPWRSSQVEFG